MISFLTMVLTTFVTVSSKSFDMVWCGLIVGDWLQEHRWDCLIITDSGGGLSVIIHLSITSIQGACFWQKTPCFAMDLEGPNVVLIAGSSLTLGASHTLLVLPWPLLRLALEWWWTRGQSMLMMWLWSFCGGVLGANIFRVHHHRGVLLAILCFLDGQRISFPRKRNTHASFFFKLQKPDDV